jgi:toxin ParE1/3/4
MKVSYSRVALAQLDDIFAYIAKDNPIAAANVVDEIEAVADHLAHFPFAGRLTDEGGVRMLVLSRYPYLIFYKVLPNDNLRILRILHGAQDRR